MTEEGGKTRPFRGPAGKAGLTQLVITPSYPPIDSSVSLINIKIIRALEERGVKSVVLTVDPGDSDLPVSRFAGGFHRGGNPVYRLRTYERGGRALELARRAAKAVFRPLFYLPDQHFVWELSAMAALAGIGKRHSIDLIHSISSPYCSHLVGYAAKAVLKRPWICHLDDFWGDQQLEHFDRYRTANLWLERKCFQRADVVLSSVREILDFASRRYGSEIQDKFFFIPPAYEPDRYPRDHALKMDKYVLNYLGRFWRGVRDPVTLFKAIRIVNIESPETYRRMEFNFYGEDNNQFLPMARELGITEAVHLHRRVDHQESLEKMTEAAVLLHLGTGGFRKCREDIFISGKLYEYFGAQRMVLALTTPGSLVERFIKEHKGLSADYNDPRDIAEKLVGIVGKYKIGQLYAWKNAPQIRDYAVDRIADKYVELFRKTTGRHGFR